jgi:hypothetical protein
MRRKLISCIGLLSFILGTVVSLPEIYSGIEFQKVYSLIASKQNSPQSILLLNNTGVVNNSSSTPIIGSNNIGRPTTPVAAFNTTQFQNQHQSQSSGHQ